MRLCQIGILMGGLLFLSEGGFAEEKWLFPFESGTFDLDITMAVGGRKMQAHGQGWYKKDKLRWDMVMAGQHISSLYDGQRAYTILLDRGIAQEIPPSQMRITKGLPEYRKYEGRHVGSEEIEGKMTDIYEYERPAQLSGRPPGSTDRVKDWIWRETEFPLKTVVTSQQGRNTTVVTDIVIDAAVSDSLFQLPKSVRNSVRRLGEDGRGKRIPSSGMESPRIGRSGEASLEPLPRGVPIYPGAKKRMRRQMAGGRIIVAAYTSGDSLTQIVRFYETRMREMGWMVRGGYEENEYAISCRKGIASCRIAVSEKKKKRRIGIEIQ